MNTLEFTNYDLDYIRNKIERNSEKLDKTIEKLSFVTKQFTNKSLNEEIS